MKNSQIQFKPIGVIESPHNNLSEIPIQPVYAKGIEGRVVLKEEYTEGLFEIDRFSHIFLFYYFHQSEKTKLRLKPYLSDDEKGIFATRAPHRVNKIGMSLVELVKIEKNILYVNDLDVINGTPLLDIKPYIRRFDSREDVQSGWQDSIPEEDASKRGIRDYNKR